MIDRRLVVQRPVRWRNPAALLLAALAAGCVHAQDGGGAGFATFKLYTRRFQPGELVRIEATRRDCPAVSATASFLGRTVDLVRSDRPFASPRYEGWAVVPLDAKPQVVTVSVTLLCGGETPEMTVERDIRIAEVAFPVQRLKVAPDYVNPPKEALARIERDRKRTAAIYASRTPLPLPGAVFVRPVPGEATSVFGAKRILNGEARSPHPGIDLAAAAGTPVVAPGPGRVALADDLYYSGETVILDHGDGLFTIYGHLSEVDVKEGATVAAGTRIGLSGATGRVTGPHLHWGARLGGEIFDPRALLDSRLFR